MTSVSEYNNTSSEIMADETKQLEKSNSSASDETCTDSQLSESISGAAKAKARKNRGKSDCNLKHVLQALNSLSTPEEKLATMCQKYSDLFVENRRLLIQNNAKQFQKQLMNVTKERDQVRADLAKSVQSRNTLENLCRELQKQNKEIKEENLRKLREEEEKRKEVSAKFQTTLTEITSLIKEDNDKTMKLRDDNIDMTSKLKSIHEQCGMRQEQIEKMTKQMALESQLYEAKLAKLEMETSAEKELLLREKQQLLVTLTEYQAKFQEYQNIEVALRNQVALYNNKYEEFEKSLTRSNKMFTSFKDEMENMSTKIVKLESETLAWKQRWEKTQKALLEMAAEKQKSDQEVILVVKQMGTLRKLCRTLQAERTQLLNKLKELGSTPETSKFEAAIDEVFADNTTDASFKDCVDIVDNAILKSSAGNDQTKINKNKSKKNAKREKTLLKENECVKTCDENSSELRLTLPNTEAPLQSESDSNLKVNVTTEPVQNLPSESIGESQIDELNSSNEKAIVENPVLGNEDAEPPLNGPSTHVESEVPQFETVNSDGSTLEKAANNSTAKTSPKKKCKK